MSNCLQDNGIIREFVTETTEEDDADDPDIIEIASDHVQPNNPLKSQTDILVEKQNQDFTTDVIENDDELLIIELQDVEKTLTEDQRTTLQSFDDMRNLNKDKKYDEWVYVETNQKTFQIHDNLLLVSSVYDDDRNCCVLQ